MKTVVASLAIGLSLTAAPASASELFGGVFAHNVDLPTTIGSPEGGADFQLGVRSEPLVRLFRTGELRAYGFGSVNSGHGLDFAAAGAVLRFPLTDRLYLQPGVGLAIHDGPGGDIPRRSDRLYLGSRVVAQLELMLGWQLSPRVAIEAGQVHLSHAKLLSDQNPGMDDLGVRLVWRFGG